MCCGRQTVGGKSKLKYIYECGEGVTPIHTRGGR